MKGGMDRRIIYANKDFIDGIKRGYEVEALKKPLGRPKEEEKTEPTPFQGIFAIWAAACQRLTIFSGQKPIR
jgi:hypothetical protein